MKKMRLFIAILVPQTLRQYCSSLQDFFPGLRKVDQFHLTLQFLKGDISNAQPIIEALDCIQFHPFKIELSAVSLFPNINRPCGVWIECVASDSLVQLQEKVTSLMKPLGFLPDCPFKPHITLGRYKDSYSGIFPSLEIEARYFSVNNFLLMESCPSANGSHYKIIKTFGEQI